MFGKCWITQRTPAARAAAAGHSRYAKIVETAFMVRGLSCVVSCTMYDAIYAGEAVSASAAFFCCRLDDDMQLANQFDHIKWPR